MGSSRGSSRVIFVSAGLVCFRHRLTSMVNRVLTSRPLCSRKAADQTRPHLRESMNTAGAERDLALSTRRKTDTRSPFVRLTELIADIKPGQPFIDLGVGEPKHGVPAFVAPVLAAHINAFGQYPRNEGTLPFREAAADWASRRFKLDRPLDPNGELLVLNGSREG